MCHRAPQTRAWVTTSCHSAAAHTRHISLLAREQMSAEAEQCVRAELDCRELCEARPSRQPGRRQSPGAAPQACHVYEGRCLELGCLPGCVRLGHRGYSAHLCLHVSLDVEGRQPAESFCLDCGEPTPPGHQDRRQCLSLRATTDGGSQQLHAHRAQRRP